MAKCIKKGNEIKRLSENDMKEVGIISYHIKNEWNFIPKSEWKKSVRGVEQTTKAEKVEKKEKVKKEKK